MGQKKYTLVQTARSGRQPGGRDYAAREYISEACPRKTKVDLNKYALEQFSYHYPVHSDVLEDICETESMKQAYHLVKPPHGLMKRLRSLFAVCAKSAMSCMGATRAPNGRKMEVENRVESPICTC